MKLRFYGADRCVTGSCHCLEVNGKHILVDCGLVFPDSDMFGVDLVIPDFTYVLEI